MTEAAILDVPQDHRVDHFREFCDDIFGTLYRSDQRRVGETYLRGLLDCPGRKSIRRMASTTLGQHSEQSLQQFVNQSPWDHEPIRQRVMNRLIQSLRPTAWVFEEVAFPKHGRYSAAVDRQYVRSMEKVCNCQLAVVVTLTSDQYSVPVNWRLTVPESWGQDAERRARARVPEHERPRPYWNYQIEMLDDMALDWGMPAAPIIVDVRQQANVEGLLSALESRGLPYLAQVSGSLHVRYERHTGAAPVGSRVPPWQGTVGDLVRRMDNTARMTISWVGTDDGLTRRSQFFQVPVRLPSNCPPGTQPAERQLIAEWPLTKPQPRGYWITNTDRPLADLVPLSRLRQRVAARIEEFAERFGLRDYEGRTFAGWHHHVTLATAAYTFCVLDEMLTEPPA